MNNAIFFPREIFLQETNLPGKKDFLAAKNVRPEKMTFLCVSMCLRKIYLLSVKSCPASQHMMQVDMMPRNWLSNKKIFEISKIVLFELS